MRFILQDDVYDHLPPNWDDLVTSAKRYVEKKVIEARTDAENEGKAPEEIDALTLKARHKAISAKSSVWRAAENALRQASHNKCWYCESIQDRSDKPVDHFRPKNSVVEAPGHPGYWWLAFDWKNYRYSCTYCNSKRIDVENGTEGGKHDHFPIIPPPPHARCEADLQDKNKLLDPSDCEDPKLLTFLPNGFPYPAKDDSITVDRVEESIRLYHLNHSAIVRKRKRLADDITQNVSAANLAIESHNQEIFRYHKKEIIKRVRAKAEYSSAARTYLQYHRTIPWVEEILSHDL